MSIPSGGGLIYGVASYSGRNSTLSASTSERSAINHTVLAAREALLSVLNMATKATGYTLPRETEFASQTAYEIRSRIEIIEQVSIKTKMGFDVYTLAGISYEFLLETTLVQLNQIEPQSNESGNWNNRTLFVEYLKKSSNWE